MGDSPWRAAEVEGLVDRLEVHHCLSAATAINGVHIPDNQVDAGLEALQNICGGAARRCVLEDAPDLVLKSLHLQLMR